VKQVPPGKVATYGQIARVAGIGRQPRVVGYALHALPEGNDVPWHRIINAKGEISKGSRGEWAEFQRQLLEDEGVEFGMRGKVDLKEYGWDK
jgi:methylated-DNA-protein-cysteine methyltransferase-like protein